MDVVFCVPRAPRTARDLAQVRALIAAHPQASRRALSQHLCAAWQWGAAQRPPARHGVPGADARVAPRRADRAAAAAPLPPQSAGAPVPAPSRGDRSDAGAHAARCAGRTRCRAGAAHRGRAAVQRADRRAPLPRLHAARRRASEVPGVRGGPAAGLRGVELGRHATSPAATGFSLSAAARRHNLHLIAANTRFLILPWVEVRHLASHLLGGRGTSALGGLAAALRSPGYFAETSWIRRAFAAPATGPRTVVPLGRTPAAQERPTHRANRYLQGRATATR